MPPSTLLFRSVACPHYTAEVGIYAALGLALGMPPTWAVLVCFVMSNLSVGAVEVRPFNAHRCPALSGPLFSVSAPFRPAIMPDAQVVPPAEPRLRCALRHSPRAAVDAAFQGSHVMHRSIGLVSLGQGIRTHS